MSAAKMAIWTGVVAAIFAQSLREARAEEPIKIGVALELSGRFVAFGSYCKDGIDLAVKRWGGTVAGKEYEIVYRDLQSDAQTTVTAFTELLNTQKINYVLGPTASPIASAAIGPWRQTKPVWIVPGASTTVMEKEIGEEPNFFHVYPYAYHYYEDLAHALKHYTGPDKKIAILFVDDAYGRTHEALAREIFTESGFQIVADEVMRANTPDLNPSLTKIRSVRPDILLGLVQSTDAITLAKQAYTRNLKVPYLVNPGTTQQTDWQAAVGEAQEGWIGLTTYVPDLVNWPANPLYPKVFMSTDEWETMFESEFKHKANYNNIMCYTNAIQLLIAIDKVGGDDKDKVASELANLDTMSPYGSTKFSKTRGGTRNQAFSDLLIFQRQKNENILLYPLSVARNAKLIAAPK